MPPTRTLRKIIEMAFKRFMSSCERNNVFLQCTAEKRATLSCPLIGLFMHTGTLDIISISRAISVPKQFITLTMHIQRILLLLSCATHTNESCLPTRPLCRCIAIQYYSYARWAGQLQPGLLGLAFAAGRANDAPQNGRRDSNNIQTSAVQISSFSNCNKVLI